MGLVIVKREKRLVIRSYGDNGSSPKLGSPVGFQQHLQNGDLRKAIYVTPNFEPPQR